MIYNKITAVIINYQTPELTEEAIRSLKIFYPELKLILIDNGSNDDSLERFQNLTDQYRNIELLPNKKNIHHGPAMHQAINLITTDYVLFIDSDCKVTKNGFIEEMLKLIEINKLNYAVGKLIFLNKRGFVVNDPNLGFPYIRPVCMLIRCSVYKELPSFQKHGSPCLKNMIAAVSNGFNLIDFDVEKYILHLGRGTASKYGYNLGIKGRINYILNKLKL